MGLAGRSVEEYCPVIVIVAIPKLIELALGIFCVIITIILGINYEVVAI
jgi:hypothetical protein